jgi:hypothetical protein
VLIPHSTYIAHFEGLLYVLNFLIWLIFVAVLKHADPAHQLRGTFWVAKFSFDLINIDLIYTVLFVAGLKHGDPAPNLHGTYWNHIAIF